MALAGLVLPGDVEHHDIEVDDGGRIHVVSRGRGQPLVLLHGVFLNSGIWVHQLADLSDELRVIAVDLRGHGRSVSGSDGFGLAAAGTPGTPGTPATSATPATAGAGTARAAGATGAARAAGVSGAGRAACAGTAPRFLEDPVGDLLDARSSIRSEGTSIRSEGTSIRSEGRRATRLFRSRRTPAPALERLALDVRQVLSRARRRGRRARRPLDGRNGRDAGGRRPVRRRASPQAVRARAHEHHDGTFRRASRMGPVRRSRARRRHCVRSGRRCVPVGEPSRRATSDGGRAGSASVPKHPPPR